MADPESESLKVARARLGRKSQLGGSLAAFIGVFLVLVTHSSPRPPVNIRQMAMIFIVIGIFLLAVGTFARWYYLD